MLAMTAPQTNQVPKVIKKFHDFFLANLDKEELVLYGGSGGSKSHSTVQHLVRLLFTESDLQMLVTRKTGPSLKATTWKMAREILSDFGYEPGRDYTLNKTDLIIDAVNGNQMRFASLDDPQKIKSASYNLVYIEEITEFSQEDYFFIKNTLRRPSKSGIPPKRIMTFNPVDINHWVWQNIILKPCANQAVIHSTHWDNPFLPIEYRNELESLCDKDENFYRVYALGEPGVLENIIYKNYTICSIPSHSKSESFYGIDFGYNNPSALIECYIKDNQPYLKELIYESHLTNNDLIETMNSLGLDKDCPFYYDSAEPQRGEEIRQAGYNAIPADKSVKDGIDHVKRFRLHIDPGSNNLLAEIKGYSYRKKGDQVLDEPVKFKDHALDAARYAMFTHSRGMSGTAVPIEMSSFGGLKS